MRWAITTPGLLVFGFALGGWAGAPVPAPWFSCSMLVASGLESRALYFSRGALVNSYYQLLPAITIGFALGPDRQVKLVVA